jgi:hypothetical protein
LCPREHLGILLVAYVLHRLPHAARVAHLAAEEAQGLFAFYATSDIRGDG